MIKLNKLILFKDDFEKKNHMDEIEKTNVYSKFYNYNFFHPITAKIEKMGVYSKFYNCNFFLPITAKLYLFPILLIITYCNL